MMENGIVLYESRYGAAKQYAEWIGETLDLPVKKCSEVAAWELAAYDFIVAGSSIYMGKTLIRNWLTQNAASLADKKLLLYIVGAAPALQKAKTDKYFTDNVPATLLKADNCFYLQGKSIYNELSFTDRLFLKIGAWLAQKPEDRKAMLNDFNEVKRSHLFPLLNGLNVLLCRQVKTNNGQQVIKQVAA